MNEEDPMDPRSYGPQIFPSAPLVRKRIEAHIDELPPVRAPKPPRQEVPDEEGRSA